MMDERQIFLALQLSNFLDRARDVVTALSHHALSEDIEYKIGDSRKEVLDAILAISETIGSLRNHFEIKWEDVEKGDRSVPLLDDKFTELGEVDDDKNEAYYRETLALYSKEDLIKCAGDMALDFGEELNELSEDIFLGNSSQIDRQAKCEQYLAGAIVHMEVLKRLFGKSKIEALEARQINSNIELNKLVFQRGTENL